MTLKVLHLIPSIAPCRGGPSVAVLAMVAALRQVGVDAAIVTTNDDGQGQLDLPVGRWIEHRGVPVLLFPRWSPPLPALRDFAFAPGLGAWMRQHLREWDLLHVHALFSWPCTWSMAMARRQRHPYLLRPIGQLQRWSLQRSPWRKRLFLAAIENANIRGASLIHATSPLEAKDLHHLALTSRIRVLPLGVPIPPKSAAPANPGRLLFLSRLHPKKRLEVLLEALAHLNQQEPSLAWQLSIAGSGEPDYVAELKALTARLGLEHRCAWLGFVSGSAKDALLQASGWFVLPSAAENFSIAAAEALACGTPVILSPNVGIAEEVEKEGAGLVCPSEPEALATILSLALRSPQEPYRDAARRLAIQRYSWPGIAADLHQIYTGLLSEPPLPSRAT